MGMKRHAVLTGFWNNPLEHLEQWFLSDRPCYASVTDYLTYLDWGEVPITNLRMEIFVGNAV
jgi:hypothetical protein